MSLVRAENIVTQLESRPLGGSLSHSTLRLWLWLQDLVVISACAALAVVVAHWLPIGPGDHALRTSSVALIVMAWSALLAMNGCYRHALWGFGVGEHNRVLVASLETFALLAVGVYVTRYEFSRQWVLALFVLTIPALIAARRLARSLIHRLRATGVGGQRVLLVGAPGPMAQLTRVLHRERWLGLTPVGALQPGEAIEGGSLPGTFSDTTTIVQAVEEMDVDVVIVCDGAFSECDEFNVLARRLERQDVELIVVPALTDISAQRMAMVPVAGLPLVFVEKPHAHHYRSRSKRAFDVLVAGVVLIVAAPITIAAALLIKLEDGGPVVFRQERIGRGGRPFDMLKLRSMVCDAERLLTEKSVQGDDGNGVLFKLREDPRVTRVGKFIRRYSIDELPQLWNVLRGDMSIVGPRPALQREVDLYAPNVHRRLAVRPGITGLWQVSGRSNLSWEDTVRLDVYYVDNWSMAQDATILLRTARAVLQPSGAY